MKAKIIHYNLPEMNQQIHYTIRPVSDLAAASEQSIENGSTYFNLNTCLKNCIIGNYW